MLESETIPPMKAAPQATAPPAWLVACEGNGPERELDGIALTLAQRHGASRLPAP